MFVGFETESARAPDNTRAGSISEATPYEQLIGDLIGTYSRRINIHHRLVYEVLAEEKIVKVLRMWSHYE